MCFEGEREPDLIARTGLGFELMPTAAFIEELTAGAVHPRRRDEVLMLESIEVGFHLSEQPGLLVGTHGRKAGNDHLRVLELHQMMELNAGLFLIRVVTVKNGIAAGLDLGCVCHLLCIGRRSSGLVVDDLTLLDEIQNADQLG